MRRLHSHAALLIVIIAIELAGIIPTLLNETVASTQSSASLDYALIILMENHPLNTSYPNGIIGNPSVPYINSLARNYGLATNYFAVASGSLPDYIALTDANMTSVNSGCSTPGPNCTTNAVNIVDEIEATGRTWKAYMEDYSGDCNGTGTSYYVPFHNPFIFYSDITNNSARCGKIVPANPGHSGLPDDRLITDLASTATASNYMWLTPNECDNMHGECSITTGDAYLSQLIPQILNSTVFKTQRAALFLVFDEPTYCPYNQCPVPAIWAGPGAKFAYSSNTYHTHYSLLSTIESLWTLQPMTSYDGASTPMTEFLQPPLTVGGVSASVDKLALIGLYLAEAITMTLAATIAVAFQGRSRRKRATKPSVQFEHP